MTDLHVRDSRGHTMALTVLNKNPHFFTCQGFNKELVDNLRDLPLRDDDILLCSFTKSGCHWLWEIARQIISGQSTTEKVEKETSMMELHTIFGDLETLASPRILNNHQFFEIQPKDMLRKKLKVLFIYRNPKDVAVSYYHHVKGLEAVYQYDGNFLAFLSRFVEGLLDNNSMFDYLRGWEAGIKANPDMNICILSYEDLKEDPMPQLRKVAKFLGHERNDDFLQAVIKSTSIDNMRKQKGDIIKSSQGGAVMYRKGQVGDWKNHFTVSQSEWFDHIIRTKMGDSELFKFKYSL